MRTARKIVLGIACVGLIVSVGYVYRERHRSAVSNCLNGLRQIDGAKQSWALEHNRQAKDIPSWADLVGEGKYMREAPVCPQGGSYAIGPVGEVPRCSY